MSALLNCQVALHCTPVITEIMPDKIQTSQNAKLISRVGGVRVIAMLQWGWGCHDKLCLKVCNAVLGHIMLAANELMRRLWEGFSCYLHVLHMS